MQNKLLIVDDEKEWLDILSLLFRRKSWTVQTASSGEEAWTLHCETQFDLVICDLSMPDITGIELLKRIRTVDKILPFIIMTGVGTIQSAVEAVQLGAFNYITKPFKTHELEIVAERAIEHGHMQRKLEYAQKNNEAINLQMVLGSHKTFQELLTTINKIADSIVPVLIQGETGTGKSMLAQYIHKLSSRANEAFMTIDCAALPETLLESELFGHVKGAFTSAHAARRGLLEEAQGGTVFLDEIGELTPTTQIKLLRAIQEREIKPVGGNKSIYIDVRFITATNRNLAKEVAEGNFREDLYYRLAVIPIILPPLRERIEDLPELVAHFVNKFNTRYAKKITEVNPLALQVLQEQIWKGNIRELENVIERACLLADGNSITIDLLGMQVTTSSTLNHDSVSINLQKTVRDAEKKAILQALAIADGNRTQAANLLGIGRRTLYDKIEEYQIDLSKF